MMNAPVVFFTDFGDSHYAGQMRGVVLGIAPGSPQIDLTHAIAPQGVAEAAHVLFESVAAFPVGSVFVCVVDPGVGTARRGVAFRKDGRFFVGPDNGIFTLVARGGVEEAVAIENEAFFRLPVSPTFNGRDVFAPVAARIATGTPLSELGPPAGELVAIAPAAPNIKDGRIDGHGLCLDRFGNLVTDIPAALLGDGRWAVLFRGRRIKDVRRTYADVAVGTLVALVGSSGHVEIAIRDGSAAAHFRIRRPEKERVRLLQKKSKAG